MTVNFLIMQVDSCPIEFVYTNHRGELSERTVTPQKFFFAATKWHSPAQWIMHAHDHDKGLVRDFAMEKMRDVRYKSNKTFDPNP